MIYFNIILPSLHLDLSSGIFHLLHTRPTHRPCSGVSKLINYCVFIPGKGVRHRMKAVRRGSVVDIPTGYGLDNRRVRVRVPAGSRIFSSPCRPPNLLYNGYRRLFPRGYSGRGVKLTTHQLVPKSGKCGSIRPLPHTLS
jgi:hypothetical protein